MGLTRDATPIEGTVLVPPGRVMVCSTLPLALTHCSEGVSVVDEFDARVFMVPFPLKLPVYTTPAEVSLPAPLWLIVMLIVLSVVVVLSNVMPVIFSVLVE